MYRYLAYEDIIKILPHRRPMLLIDYAHLYENEVVGFKDTKDDDFYFDGHFPDNKIFPGVLLIEAIAQSACLLSNEAKNVYLTKIQNAKFIKPVLSNKKVEFHAFLKDMRRNYHLFSGFVMIDNIKHAECEFSALTH